MPDGQVSGEKPYPLSDESLLTRAYERGGLNEAVREATSLFKGYGASEALKLSQTMTPQLRRAVIKMVAFRNSD